MVTAAPGGPGTFWIVAGAIALVLLAWVAWAALSGTATRAAAQPTETPAEARQRELLELNLGKPGDPVLGGMYTEISVKHFSGRLPDLPLLWEPRLAEVGQLAGQAFTLEGMFGHVGAKAAILLSPTLQSDEQALRRALCHEVAHAYLYSIGQPTEKHGSVFQSVLQRLAAEGAFKGIVATEDERRSLRAWIDSEAARLSVERDALARENTELEQERLDLEQALADLNARRAAGAGRTGPSSTEIEAFNARLEAHNWRVGQTKSRAERGRADLATFNQEVERYNLMVAYPDGR